MCPATLSGGRGPGTEEVTMGSAVVAPALSDEQIAEFLELTKGVDSVELKLTVPESDRARGARRSAWIPSTPRSGRSTSSTRRT